MAKKQNEQLLDHARTLYELTDLEHKTIALRVGITPETLKRWAKAKRWKRGQKLVKESIEQTAKVIADIRTQSPMAIAEEVGCGQRYQVQKAFELSEARKINYITENAEGRMVTVLKSVSLRDKIISPDGEPVFQIGDEFYPYHWSSPDFQVQEKGLKLLVDMCGNKIETLKRKEEDEDGDLKPEVHIFVPKKREITITKIEEAE